MCYIYPIVHYAAYTCVLGDYNILHSTKFIYQVKDTYGFESVTEGNSDGDDGSNGNNCIHVGFCCIFLANSAYFSIFA